MKSVYDEYEKYDVNKDEEFLNHLKSENAFAYYLIKSNAKRPYKKSGLYSSSNKEESESGGKLNRIKKILENPSVQHAMKRIGNAAISGAVGAISNRVKANTAQQTLRMLGNKRLKSNNILNAQLKKGKWRV